jgi:hypothetical protein
VIRKLCETGGAAEVLCGAITSTALYLVLESTMISPPSIKSGDDLVHCTTTAGLAVTGWVRFERGVSIAEWADPVLSPASAGWPTSMIMAPHLT